MKRPVGPFGLFGLSGFAFVAMGLGANPVCPDDEGESDEGGEDDEATETEEEAGRGGGGKIPGPVATG